MKGNPRQSWISRFYAVDSGLAELGFRIPDSGFRELNSGFYKKKIPEL